MYYYEVIKITNKLEIEMPEKEMVPLTQILDEIWLEDSSVSEFNLPHISHDAEVDPDYVYNLVEPKGYKKINLGDKTWYGWPKPSDPRTAVRILESVVAVIDGQIGIESEEILFGGRIQLSGTSVTNSKSWMEGEFVLEYFESKNGNIGVYKNLTSGGVTKVVIKKNAKFIDILKDLVDTNVHSYVGALFPYFEYKGGSYNRFARCEDFAEWECKRGILGTKLELSGSQNPLFVYAESNGERKYTEHTRGRASTPYPKDWLLFCSASYNPRDTNANSLKESIESVLNPGK